MANPLDAITGYESVPADADGRRRVVIRTPGAVGPDGAPEGDNLLTQALTPEQPVQQLWTMDDLLKGLAALKEHIATGEFSPGTKIGNRLFGTGGEERYQTWPEKMVRSGVGAAGNALSSLEPVTSEQLIGPAMDMAGLVGGSALIERPGAATLGSGPVRPAARTMPTEPAPVFYSALEHAATSAAQDVMSPQQWLGYLKNQPGVKAEELAWTGIGDWLGAQKGKVKKEDVQRYLDEHKVEIKDVTKQDEGHIHGDDWSEHSMNQSEEHASRVMKEEFNKLPAEERAKYEDVDDWIMNSEHTDRLMDRHGDIASDWLDEFGERIAGPHGAKYSSYQLPGGENYREHLLTMPEKAPTTLGKEDGLYRQHPDNYRSSHWDEPNVLAHVRTNDRTIDGKKTLHIEEIQSDWHQQGRKQGYKGSDDPSKWTVTRESLPNGEHRWVVRDSQGRKIRYSAAETAEQALKFAREDAPKGVGVPDAPFKTSWPELALKRMIRKAAEEGYDRISWTPGEAQAARYDLSKQIKSIAYERTPDGKQYILDPVSHSGRDFQFNNGKKIAKDKLADYVGKEVAEKIISAEKPEGTLEGLDLKVGGEGMREFYDKMLPKMVEKIGKAHGVKVKQGEIPLGDIAGADASMAKAGPNGLHLPVHYFDLPQSLRDHAIGKGFPLYMAGVPFPLVPVDHDPFKKKERK